MFTPIRKATALAGAFVFLGLAVTGCDIAGPIGPSSLPAAIAAQSTDSDPAAQLEAPAPVLAEDSDLQMAPLCASAAARFDALRWAAQAPGKKPVCR